MTRTASLADLAGAIDAGPLAGFRNAIINGNFDIWQRGTSGTTSYVADRWAGGATGSTIAQSRQAFSLGQTDVPNEPTYFHRTVVTSSAGASNFSILSQLVEDVRTFAAQTVTLSFWAKADASKNMAVEFQQVFGTGGSPSTAVSSLGVTTCALTTSWKKFSVVLTLPSISGKTLGSDNNSNLRLNFWFDAGSSFNSRTSSLGQQSGTFDLAQVQLEAGPVATPFERRPFGAELQLCKRYAQVLGGNFAGNVESSNTLSIIEKFEVQMRADPTISVRSGQTCAFRYGAGDVVINSPGLSAATASTTALWTLVTGGGGYGSVPYPIMARDPARNFILASAEL